MGCRGVLPRRARADAGACSDRCRVRAWRWEQAGLSQPERERRRLGLEPGDLLRTPPQVLAYVAERWGPIELDVSALPSDTVAPRYVRPELDGRVHPWPWVRGGHAWCNPPYSRAGGPLLAWVLRALAEVERGRRVTLLLPHRPGVAWWRELEGHTGATIVPLGRLRYIDPETGEPTPGTGRLASVLVHLVPGLVSASGAVLERTVEL